MNWSDGQGSLHFLEEKATGGRDGMEVCMPGRERKKSLAHSPAANWAPAWSNSCFTTAC